MNKNLLEVDWKKYSNRQFVKYRKLKSKIMELKHYNSHYKKISEQYKIALLILVISNILFILGVIFGVK